MTAKGARALIAPVLMLVLVAPAPRASGTHHPSCEDILRGANSGSRPIRGAGSGDVLVGTDDDDVILGGAGPDTIRGLKGRDLICGGRGDDRIMGGRSANELRGGPGDDLIYAGGTSRLTRALSWAAGGRGDDVLLGDPRADTFFGGPGDDRLEGSTDCDSLDGGPGADHVDGGPGHAHRFGGPDDCDTLTFYGARGGIRVDLGAGKSTGLGRDTIARIGAIEGSRWDDVLIGTSGDETFTGGRGADLMRGRTGKDWFRPGTGDEVDGGRGRDTMAVSDVAGPVHIDLAADFGEGLDLAFRRLEGATVWTVHGATVLGTDGRDVIDVGHDRPSTRYLVKGRGGNDLIEAFGNAFVQGGLGADEIDVSGQIRAEGGAGDDVLDGGTGHEALYGNSGDDLLNGWHYQDHLHGGPGNDEVTGSGGDDLVTGGSGDDELTGDEGYDVVDGGPGTDDISGGAEQDACAGGETSWSCERQIVGGPRLPVLTLGLGGAVVALILLAAGWLGGRRLTRRRS